VPRLNPPRRITKATSHSTLSIRTFWPLGKRAKRPVRSSLVSIRRSYQADQVRIFIKVRKLQCKPSPDALPNQERAKLPASKVSFTPERKLSPHAKETQLSFHRTQKPENPKQKAARKLSPPLRFCQDNRTRYQTALLSRATAKPRFETSDIPPRLPPLGCLALTIFSNCRPSKNSVEFHRPVSLQTLNPRKCTFQMKVYLTSFPLSDDPLPLARPPTKEPFYPCYYYHLRPSKLALTTAHP
jgi:hypothetical protein